jgi:hypothetical protein
MAERLTRKQAIRSGAALLTGLVRCGHCGHAMHVAYKTNRFQYVCSIGQSLHARPNCQYVTGTAIDEAVVREFFRVLQPAQIDALEQVEARRAEHQRELERHLEQEVRRLEYAASRAERQYDSVDPENRLIAATLETRWEAALSEREQARSRLAELRAQSPQPVAIPNELRAAFTDIGRRLPEVWDRLPIEARKTLLRTLVTGVNLRRDANGVVTVRIVWIGGQVSETSFPVPVSTFRFSDRERQIVVRIRQVLDEGHNDTEIAEMLNRDGLHPCRGASFTAGIVLKLRCRHRILTGLERVRRGERTPGYTVREMAHLIGTHPSWIYRAIGQGQIEVAKDARFGCYLFPRTKAAIERMNQLRCGKVRQVSFREEHCDG